MSEFGIREKWRNKQFAIDFLLMRKAIGILAFTMPFILVAGYSIAHRSLAVKSSVSVFYYSNMGDVFVGILCAVALFLFSYRGYYRIDNITGTLGSVFALGMAFCPCAPDKPAPDLNPLLSNLHLISAGFFFAILVFFSMYLFTRSHTKKEYRGIRKKMRNRLYRTCGVIMLICIGIIPVIEHFFSELLVYNPEFWLESTALCAFGVSWSVKGKVFLRDKPRQNNEITR